MRDDTVAVYKYFALKCAKKMSLTYKADGNGEMLVDFAGVRICKIPISKCCEFSSEQASLECVSGTGSLTLTYKGDGYADILDFTIE